MFSLKFYLHLPVAAAELLMAGSSHHLPAGRAHARPQVSGGSLRLSSIVALPQGKEHLGKAGRSMVASRRCWPVHWHLVLDGGGALLHSAEVVWSLPAEKGAPVPPRGFGCAHAGTKLNGLDKAWGSDGERIAPSVRGRCYFTFHHHRYRCWAQASFCVTN